MARTRDRLSAAALKTLPPGTYIDGAGLMFVRRKDGGAHWVLRYTSFGKRRDMGLGGYPDVSLKNARLTADGWRAVIRAGKDPIKERRNAEREAQRNQAILTDIALDAYESRKAELKGDGKAGRWFSPLELHVLPKLGKMPVAMIDQRDIRDTLAPIWHDKAETARKAMNRLSIVMRHAAALGLDVDLQATEKAKALLGKQRHTATNIPALPWQDAPGFYRSLDGGTTTELALRFLLLTAVRSGPLRVARLDQIKWRYLDHPGRGHERSQRCDDRFPCAVISGSYCGSGTIHPDEPRRVPVPKRSQRRHIGRDHEQLHEAPWNGRSSSWLSVHVP